MQSTGYVELEQNNGEYDMILDSATDGTGAIFTYNGNNTGEFDLVSINVDNPGMQITAYQGALPVAIVVINQVGVYTFGSDFEDITAVRWTNTDTRSIIEEITFRDNQRPVEAGFYEITYTVGEEPCVESTTHTIEVYPSRSTEIEDVAVCQSASGTINLSALMTENTTLGGTWTVVNTTLSIPPVLTNDVLNYQIDFADVPPYGIEIQYSLDTLVNTFNPGACNPAPTTATILITDVAETGFDLPDTWCVEDGNINLSQFTVVGGGTYSLAATPEIALSLIHI